MSTQRRRLPARQRQAGLSLVELLVAITIGAILLGGAVSLFVGNKVTYQITSDLSRLQENARFALEMMVRDIRMAGYFGCANDMTKVTNNVTGIAAGSLWDISAAIEGVNDDTAAWSPSNLAIARDPADAVGLGGEAGNIATGTDAITVRYAVGVGTPVNAGSSPTLLTVDDTTPFTVNDVAIVSDCGAADMFIVNGLDGTAVPQEITPNALSRAYEADANPTVSTYYGARYYVGNNGRTDADGTPHKSLYRSIAIYEPGPAPGCNCLREDPRELVDGVDAMELLYGLDTNDDGAPDQYVNAGSGTLNSAVAWRQVVTVRIALLLRTVDQYGTVPDNKRYRLHGAAGPALPPFGDMRQRRLFITTAVVRNLQ